MLTLISGHIWSMITEGSDKEIEVAVEALTVSNPDYYQANKRGNRSCPRKISVLQGGRIFPTGLIPIVTRALKKEKLQVLIKKSDLAPVPVTRRPTVDMLNGIELNDAQMAAITAMIDAPVPRGYLKAHPGFGKTEVIFATYLCFKPCLALLVVTRAGLREQSAERGRVRLGEEPYVLGASKGPLPKSGLIISTYQTLYNRLFGRPATRKQKAIEKDPKVVEWIQKVQIVYGDEIHRGSSPGYLEILKACPADRRYGVSATPLRSRNAYRNLLLRGFIGEQLYNVSVKDQLIKKRISKGHVFFSVMGRGDPVHLADLLDYHAAFTQAYMGYDPFLKQVMRDAAWSYKNNLPCVILVDWRAPGTTFYQLLSKIIPAHHVGIAHGGYSVKHREETKEKFIRGELKVLVGTTRVLGEGEDLPNIASLLLACPGRDPDVLFQRVGRGLRPKKGRENVLYLKIYVNMRHKYFIGQAKDYIRYFERNSVLYTTHGEDPMEIINDSLHLERE